MAGDFEVVNKYLVNDLKKLNLWCKELKDKIIMNRGSVQGIQEIPQDIQKIYKTAWDLSQKVIIEQSSERGIYVCQIPKSQIFGWQNLKLIKFRVCINIVGKWV